MKTSSLISGLIILSSISLGANANPIGIDILSESHHIRGSAGMDEPGYTYVTYELTSNNSLHYRAEGTSETNGNIEGSIAESWAGDFNVKSFSQRWVGASMAESTYIFKPENHSLDIDVAAMGGEKCFEYDVWLTLDNLSTGVSLLNETYAPLDGLSIDIVEDYALIVDPSNMYELHMYVRTDGGDVSSMASLDVDIASVPEPATIFLMATGLAGLGFSRKKKKVHMTA